MQIKQVLQKAKKQLAQSSKTPGLDAEILLADTLQISREALLAGSERFLPGGKLQDFQGKLEQREKGQPVAQIVGRCEFFNLEFQVDGNVLIPREASEMLLEKTINFLKPESGADETVENVAVVDVGTGSGCLAICCAKHLPGCRVFALDLCPRALRLAQKNAAAHNVAVEFFHSDLLANFPAEKLPAETVFVANLPYLPKGENLPASVVNFEPHLALFGGNDGLEIYREFFKQVEKRAPRSTAIFFEILKKQESAARQMCNEIFSKGKVLEFSTSLCGEVAIGAVHANSH